MGVRKYTTNLGSHKSFAMEGKFRFKVPTADEMTGKDNAVKSMSVFESYKKNKDATTELSKETLKDSVPKTYTSISAKPKPLSSSNTQQSASTSNSSVSSCNSLPQPSISSAESSGINSLQTKTSPTKAASTNSIIVNFRQRGNPILKHIRNVPWEYNTIIPDYVVGKSTCALYLSLRYHQLNPSYIHNRLKELGKGYDLRVLLAQVDVKEPHHLLKDLAKMCILADLTLILAFSPEEAGRYLETYKVYENKPPDVLMEKIDKDYVSKLTDTLTSVKSVNKTDSMTLLSTFKTTEGIINASKEDLSLCAGFGPQKAQRLYDVFHEPFLKSRKRLPDPPTEAEIGTKKKTK